MKVLFIGDICGSPGRLAAKELIPLINKEHQIDFVIANGENAAGGSGVTPSILSELLSSGIDVLTSGDHIWKKREIYPELDSNPRILRPANYPSGNPGKGATVISAKNGIKIGVVNLVGRVFMQPVECPFRIGLEEVNKLRKETNLIFVDMHAEATSEKIALGWYLDGSVSAICGTHTHVQTADEKIMPKGTAFISDLGMTGPFESVIGRRIDDILVRFINQTPIKFDMAENDIRLDGVVIDVDEKTGRSKSITRVEKKLK